MKHSTENFYFAHTEFNSRIYFTFKTNYWATETWNFFAQALTLKSHCARSTITLVLTKKKKVYTCLPIDGWSEKNQINNIIKYIITRRYIFRARNRSWQVSNVASRINRWDSPFYSYIGNIFVYVRVKGRIFYKGQCLVIVSSFHSYTEYCLSFFYYLSLSNYT